MTREQRIVTVSSTAHFLTHMFILIFPAVVVPYARETGQPLSAVFGLGFMMYLLYGALAIPAGYLADHWSRIGILRICMGGMGLFSLLAGSTADPALFALALAGIGAACGLYHPAGLGLISHEIDRQGKAHGINGIFGNFGIAAAPLFAGGVMLFFDWRWVYWAGAFLGFAGVALTYALPFTVTSHSDLEKKKGADPHRADHWLWFGVLCVAMTFAGLTYRANMTALPAYFETEAAGLARWLASALPDGATADRLSGAAGLMVSSVFMVSMVGQWVGGRSADRFDLRLAYLSWQALSFPFVVGMALFAGFPLYLAAMGHVFFALGMQPIENSLVGKLLPRRWLSTGYGIKFTLTFGVGSLAVKQVAWVEERGGLRDLYPMLAGEIGVIVAFAALLWGVSRRAMPRIANDPSSGDPPA
ncbi:MAG: MFS transporter [Nitrospinae bacterium]|nr:MFS transporter [Nitrospinota bacterium]